MSASLPLKIAYDRGSDVLYITAEFEAATKGVEDAYGILWRYGQSGVLVGATVIDYLDIWHDRLDELAGELAGRFHVPKGDLRRALVN